MPSLVHDTGNEYNYIEAIEAMLADAKKLAALTSGTAKQPKTVKEDEAKLRRKITMIAKKVAFEVGDPADIARSKWVELADVGAVNLFIDWKVFDHIPPDDPSGISIKKLSGAVGAEASVIERISSLLVSTSTLRRTPSNNLTHSRISPLYTSSHPFSPLVTVAIGNGMRPYSQWPSYFNTYGRREPSQLSHTPFSYAWGHPELEPWAVKALYPDYARQFEKSMQSRDMVTGYLRLVGPDALYDFSWVGDHARRERVGRSEPKKTVKPVVVDVGGGLGQLLTDVLREIPAIQAPQCVLQDRKEVIEAATARIETDRDYSILKDVVKMEHDFHAPQPEATKGAVVYFLRRILLDYPDSLAIGILRHLADALPTKGEEADKARVFIIEPRLLDTPNPMNRIVDMVMLNIGGKLRNEKMYRHLCEKARLEVVGYYTRETDTAVVVECKRA
ncbi:Demethylsterigmatocystin 6-O-methyltransferase [Naviculisporaceae sp. PSN 640]